MKYLILISVILTFNFSAFSFDENIAKATVKIFNKSQSNSAYSPWDYSNVSGGTGSGVVLGEGRILTNAHVVSNSKYLYIKRNEDPYEYPAKIVHIAHECDLAVLDVTDNREEFYKKIAFAELGVSPQLREKVNTVGYPKGGSKISVTEGVVSRIEYHIYVHDGASKHLAIQTDAAINNGNSGGPVVKGGKVVGIAYQSRTDGQNIGYFIPLFVVERFLKDIDMDGKYDGYIDNGLIVSDMKNTGLKKYSGLSEDSGVGIIVTAIKRNSPLKNFIKKDDVILEIDGVSIADDATVTSEFGRVEWIHVLENKFINDKVKFKIMRDRKMKIVEAKMLPSENMISNVNQYEFDYPYFIKAGYVFTVLSRDYLESWGKNWYYDAELYQMFHYSFFEYMEKEKRDEIVVLSKILPADINKYGRELSNKIVKKVNGKEIKDFNDLIYKIGKYESKEEFLTIEFENTSEMLIIPTNKIKESDDFIRKTYNIRNLLRVKLGSGLRNSGFDNSIIKFEKQKA